MLFYRLCSRLYGMKVIWEVVQLYQIPARPKFRRDTGPNR